MAITVTVLQTFFNALCAYCFAKRQFPGRDIIFVLFLATMMVPGQITLIPNYIILKRMPFFGDNDAFGVGGHGMLDSYWGLILPGIVGAFGIFLLRQYMTSIPDELLDAARVDGAGEFRIFWRVVLPLCTPALAANAIFTFQYTWEDFLWPLIVLSSPDLTTAPVGLALFAVHEPHLVDRAVRRLGDRHHPDDLRVHVLPAAVRPGHRADRHQGLGDRWPATSGSASSAPA